MVSPLTTTKWRRVCAAAAPHQPVPEAEAREALERLLFVEYPGYRYEHDRVVKDIKQSKQSLKQLDAFARLYRLLFLPDFPADQFEAIVTGRSSPVMPGKPKTKRDLWAIADIRWRVLSKKLGATAQKYANDKNKDEQRAWLYHALCEMWLDFFQGLERPPVRPQLPPMGRACTPLVDFILAAMALVMPKGDLPKPGTVRDNIELHRTLRANVERYLNRRARESGFARPS